MCCLRLSGRRQAYEATGGRLIDRAGSHHEPYSNEYMQYHHKLLRILSPLLIQSFLHLQGISLILLRISSCVMCLHSRRIASLNSSTVAHLPPRSLCFIISQIPSIGLRSGLCAGCSSSSRFALILSLLHGF